MTISAFALRLTATAVLAAALAACHGGGAGSSGGGPLPDAPGAGTGAAPATPMLSDGAAPAPDLVPGAQPAATGFMPSTWGKIRAFQVFDETNNGYITAGEAAANGDRYAAVWGARPGLARSWRASNPGLEAAYYNTLETDASPTGWGGIGHTLTWWREHHPTWVLYACNSRGTPTHIPASIPGLNNVPLDVHNPAVVDYQTTLNADYAIRGGYNALAIDEVTFWFAGSGGRGNYPCGIWDGGRFVRRYSGPHDSRWADDVVAWVKRVHTILRTDPSIAPHRIKLIVNHPAAGLSTLEEELLANVDADLDETGYTDYGRYRSSSSPSLFLRTVEWAKYAQQHGAAVLINQNWGPIGVGPAELDYSLATYLMGDDQAESIFTASKTGYGIQDWHAQYNTDIGSPCGDYYRGSSPSIYYRRFSGALAVVNAGSPSAEVARLPAGHAYVDITGRPVHNPMAIPSGEGYVLKTTDGCR